MAHRSWLPGAALASLALLGAACGGSAAPAGSNAATSSSAVARPVTGAAGLKAASSPYGSVLVTTSGRTLYGLTADSATKSVCTSSACVAVWPPLVVTGAPQLGSGVSQSLVNQLARPDGSHQLTYGGHPLYTFASDTAPGQANGEGITNFGGTWYVISAATGKLVMAKTSGGSSSTSSSGGGYGY